MKTPIHSRARLSASRSLLLTLAAVLWAGLESSSPGQAPPPSVQGLTRWLEPGLESYADGQEITVLHDQSGTKSAHPMDLNLVGSSPGPIMRINGAGGHPDATFPDTQPRQLGGWPPEGSAVTAFAVISVSGTAYTPLLDGGNGQWSETRIDGSPFGCGSFGLYHAGGAIFYYPQFMPNSGLHLFAVVSGTSYYQVYVDGVAQGRWPGAFSCGSGLVLVGGPLSEYLEYNTALSDSDVSTVSSSLALKFGITLGPSNTWNNEMGPGGWVWNPNPVMSPTQTWETIAQQEPSVIQLSDSTFVMSYTGGWTNSATGWATSADGINWTTQDHPIVGLGYGGASGMTCRNNLYLYNGTYYLFYADGAAGGNLWRVQSTDGINWTNNQIVVPSNVFAGTPQDVVGWANSALIIENGIWKMWMEGNVKSAGPNWQTFYCESTDGLNFSSSAGSGNPLPQGPLVSLQRGGNMWGGPNIIKIGSNYHMWHHATLGYIGPYTPTDIYHSFSSDGVNWTQIPNWVVPRLEDPTPDAQPGGIFYPTNGYGSQVADPFVVQLQNGTTAMYFSRVKNENASASPPIITSEILRAIYPGTVQQLLTAGPMLTPPSPPSGLRIVKP